MSTVEQDQSPILQNNIKYVFNLFNIPQPYSNNNNSQNNSNNIVTDPRSPTSSILSENSVECSLSGLNMVSDAASSSSEESEQELTNLKWLTELRNQLLKPIIDDDCLDSTRCTGKGALSVKTNEESTHSQQKRPTPSERYNTFLEKVKKDIVQYNLAADIYQTDVEEKPPFNYSHIIGMAMVENGRMTLQQICSWIESKFAFFRVRKKWNNSIRHNLSLHHCFRKIDRSKYEKGKGGYWELGIDPKKCDRKRIRNRKSSNRSRPSAGLLEAKVRNRMHVTEGFPDIQATTKKAHIIKRIDNEVREFVLDELDVQQNIVISKDTATVSSEFLATSMSIQTTKDSRMCHNYDMNGPIQLRDVFIANDGDDCGKLATSQNLDGGMELGTIIVNSTASDLGCIPSMNICDFTQQINVFVEDEIPEPCENIVISSYLSNETNVNQSQPNVIVEQIMEPYHTVSTSESSFRPYIDGIDEAFHYLRSMDSRCDDLFDNLLDISVSDY